MKDKIERQRAIHRIIGKHRISSQDELMSLLAKEGIEATQATVSRDLKEMRIVKMHSPSGGHFYSVPTDLLHVVPSTDVKHTLSSILSIEFSGALAVVKTRPGYANMLGAIIDGNAPEGVMGSIAGDDTLLIVMREGTNHQRVLEDISSFMPGIESKIK
ncbi:MAG: arginine repressor [Bacteroidales bacterium]|nr:arginine repressor [Bacteroidales bacterium]MBQ9172785.1 arginine repressor [Bacteroidales bacterium]MBQ9713046.1 arginine repressor [Bacteroidales bacterium]MBR1434384.1 arginine repressor [Bacteroidales bacterium]